MPAYAIGGIWLSQADSPIHAFDSINHLFLISQMIVPGSCYWNVGIGRNKGDVEKDEEGLRTMRVLGENMAWVLENVAGRQQA